MTGLPAACMAIAAVLICSNCASRSGLRLPLQGLAIHLPAVLQRCQQFRDGALADPVPHCAQRRCQLRMALRNPSQQPHRVALGRRFQQLTQVFQQCRIRLRQCRPAATGPAYLRPTARRDRPGPSARGRWYSLRPLSPAKTRRCRHSPPFALPPPRTADVPAHSGRDQPRQTARENRCWVNHLPILTAACPRRNPPRCALAPLLA